MVASVEQNPHLIGVDWGSTSLRVFLIDQVGAVIQTRSNDQGCSKLNASPAAFEACLRELAGDWLSEFSHLKVLACGMVGSKHGWHEVPYVLAPSNVQDIAQHVGRLADVEQARIHIVPGVQCRSLDGIPDGIPDVMRGEETQILGALTMLPECAAQSCMILPGTHSKWVHVQDAMIQKFATHMTGELFALLRQHSVLGRLMCSTAQLDSSAFTRGVRDAKTGKENGLTHQLFAVRTLGLMDDLPPEHLSDYMSGLLIGYEIQAGLSWRIQAKLQHAPIVIIGDAILCARYALALSCYGIENVSVLDNTAAQGLWRIEQAIIEPSHSQSEKIKNEKYLF